VNGVYATCATNKEIASVSRLNQRDVISALPFVPDGGLMATSYGAGCGFKDRGQFLEGGIGFIGFKFNNGTGDQYGWVRVQMKGSANNTFKVLDYAYGDPGEKVVAGQRESNSSAPVLESLGGLALGGAGLLAWRRRRVP
jgi:MYXO-CTERM domain-containing protein